MVEALAAAPQEQDEGEMVMPQDMDALAQRVLTPAQQDALQTMHHDFHQAKLQIE